jgi:hypothetical protein
VYVAPDTTSMSALPARSASRRRMGSARALISFVWASAPVSESVSTPVSRPRVSSARTWIEENGVVSSGPVPALTPGSRGAGAAVRRSGGGGFAGGCVS